MQSREAKAERRRVYRHGLSTMKRAIDKLGSRAIPGNTKLGYALRAWRKELISDLGGDDNVTLAQRTIIECASTTKLMIGSLDAWIMAQSTLITRDRKLMPVIPQRQQLVDSLTRMLVQLGLERKAAPAKSLEEILSEPDGDRNGDEP